VRNVLATLSVVFFHKPKGIIVDHLHLLQMLIQTRRVQKLPSNHPKENPTQHDHSAKPKTAEKHKNR
jgi:hypothetical protein